MSARSIALVVVGSSPNGVTPTDAVTPLTSRMTVTMASRDDDRLRLALGGEQDGELVAAQAPEDVGLAQAVAQRAGAGDDELVARGVAEAVVDRLEAVEVEHEQRALGAVAPAARDVLGQRAIDAAAVEQPGERVVIGQVAQLVLEAAALGDVLDLHEHVDRRALVVAHDGGAQRDPHGVAVGVDDAQLGGHAVVGQQRGEGLGGELLVVGVQQLLVAQRGELLGRAAGDGGQRGVDALDAAVDADQRHADGGAVEGDLEAALGLAAGALGQALLGDVARDEDDPLDRAVAARARARSG